MANKPSLRVMITCVLDVKPVLKKNLGLRWGIFMFSSFGYAQKLFKQTKWGQKQPDVTKEEADFANSLFLFPAMYKKLLKKMEKSKALMIMKEVIFNISYRVDSEYSRGHRLHRIKDPFMRWLKYRALLITETFGPFNVMEDLAIFKDKLHYIVRRCIFHDVFSAVGTPELTRFICDYDQYYHEVMFPEFKFDRKGDNKNTIGYGKDICHYLWRNND